MSAYRFSVIIEKDQDGYFASCPELQGCYTQGSTYEEALENPPSREGPARDRRGGRRPRPTWG